MMTLEEAREFFKHDIFATEQAEITIEAVGENYAKCEMPVKPMHKNAAGAVMGGALFTLADFAFAVAGNSGGMLTVTVSSNISFVGTCKGDVLYAETRLIKDGNAAVSTKLRSPIIWEISSRSCQATECTWKKSYKAPHSRSISASANAAKRSAAVISGTNGTPSV